MNTSAFFLSLRYLRGKSGTNQTRRRIIGAIFGIAVSIVPLILVMQVADGMIEGITRRYVEIGTFHLQIRSFGEGEPEEINRMIDEIGDVQGVTAAFPVVQGTALLYSQQGSTGAAVRGLPVELYKNDPAMQKYFVIQKGNYDLEEENSILVSGQMAEKLGVVPGDSLKMLTGKSVPGRPIILRPTRLTVKGTFTTGYRDLDTLSVVLPYHRASKLFREPGSVSIGVKVKDPYSDIREIIWHINGIAPQGWYVYSWYELEKSMYKSLENTRNLLFFIMALVLIVASVNISSVIVMIVMERQRDIALLKSIGAGPVLVRRTFLYTGFWIGVLGTFFGILAGVLIAANINEIIRAIEAVVNGIRNFSLGLIHAETEVPLPESRLLNPDYYLEQIPISLKYLNICFISVLSVVLSLVAAFFPARRAGKTMPLEILRRF